jgi:hypothetical protein
VNRGLFNANEVLVFLVLVKGALAIGAPLLAAMCGAFSPRRGRGTRFRLLGSWR